MSFTSSFAVMQSKLFLLILDCNFWLSVNFSFSKSFTNLSFSPKAFIRNCAESGVDVAAGLSLLTYGDVVYIFILVEEVIWV